MKYCTATTDDRHFAVEFFINNYGDTKHTPQSGLALYEISKNGLIAGARIYDDPYPDRQIWSE
jgi:hypothetical protein